jgi:D-xylose transport system permease protein
VQIAIFVFTDAKLSGAAAARSVFGHRFKPRRELTPALEGASSPIVTAAVTISYRAMPFPVLILLAVVAVTGCVLRLTAFGRRFYAIGGNRRAAILVGVDIPRHTLAVFVGMRVLYGPARLVLVSRLASAPPNAGPAWNSA